MVYDGPIEVGITVIPYTKADAFLLTEIDLKTNEAVFFNCRDKEITRVELTVVETYFRDGIYFEVTPPVVSKPIAPKISRFELIEL